MNVERLDAGPVRWYTLLGLVLVPLLVAGGFLLAGVNADSRLHTVQAAVVNLDEAVTIDGQYTPLGRQLTANLVDSDRTENLTWVLQNETNARAGLATGEYAAMVVIPKNFSAAATSFSDNDGDTAEQATIQVYTSPVAGVADATLGRLVASEAASTLNSTLTEAYLTQIYLGFNETGKQFVTLADGSDQLADGARKLADGISAASDGTRKLYTGQRALADGLGEMAGRTASMPKDIRKLANGVSDYVDGVNTLVDSSTAGQQTMISTVKQFEAGAGQLATAFGDFGSNTQLVQGATQAAEQAAGQVSCPTFSDDEATQTAICQGFKAGLTAGADVGANVGVAAAGQAAQQGVEQFGAGLTQFREGLESAANDKDTAAQLAQLKAGGRKLVSGTDELADQMPALVKGISQSADGASQLADGIDSLGAGLISASDGGQKLADGMREMADGIADGKDQLPSYSKSDRESLSTVVASPIDTSALSGLANANVGWVSLLLVLALWLGALATYSVVKAVGTGLLNSAESTAVLIARALVPGLVIVGVQAVVVAALAQFGLDLSPQKWLAVTGVLLLAGATFVVVNHALVAWLNGVGRLISILFAVLTSASALIGAAPEAFAVLRGFSPLSPALDSIRAIVTESSGATTSAFVLVGWLLLGFTASAVAVARRRTTTLAAVLAAG
ncbi:YhgE/Pip domain-containing protein [Propionicimonas sp.]|uniref:YhgE/Pip domain-containing protein n=1 Tax=Propionicimonas sp. TaxID=1955623 RepID=UPI0039E43C3B